MGKPHGLGGEVYVVPISDDPHRFDPGSRLLNERGDDLVVERSRPHHERFLVKFEGIGTRDEAERLRGALYVVPDDLRSLGDEEFWEHDLMGCSVVTTDGTDAGEIEAVIPGAAQDLLQLRTGAGERYVPLVKEIVVAVDIASRTVTIDPPAGLLD